MTERLMSDQQLMKRLGAHPDLRSQIESLVLAVEDETGDLKTADAAEMRVIEVKRRSGHEALQAWATRQVEKTAQEIKQTAGVWSEGKKNSAGTPPLVTSRHQPLPCARPVHPWRAADADGQSIPEMYLVKPPFPASAAHPAWSPDHTSG